MSSAVEELKKVSILLKAADLLVCAAIVDRAAKRMVALEATIVTMQQTIDKGE